MPSYNFFLLFLISLFFHISLLFLYVQRLFHSLFLLLLIRYLHQTIQLRKHLKLQRLLKTIDSEVTKNDNWDEFAYHFDQVHGNYLQKLYLLNIRLSPREIKLAALLRMNMSSKEISQLLNIETRSVELARYRLRKKLCLERKQNLVEFLISLDKS